MFPIDPSKLPSLRTRRALIIVDPQNDFLSKDGALPVTDTEELPGRIAGLVTQFREMGGEIIWACSQFERSRSDYVERILTSDMPLVFSRERERRGPGGRGRRDNQEQQGSIQPSKCPESFLTTDGSPDKRACVLPGTPGTLMHPVIAAAVDSKRDHQLTKTYYSAFRQNETLLHLLRMRIVTELFVCGSLSNVGVMATAFDASSHGYELAVVEDCCGYRDLQRHNSAVHRIAKATGCGLVTGQECLETMGTATRTSAAPQEQRRAPKREEEAVENDEDDSEDDDDRPDDDEDDDSSEDDDELGPAGEPATTDLEGVLEGMSLGTTAGSDKKATTKKSQGRK